MPLPKLETPTYTLKLPSTGKTISYRPFLVKEEKLLLMAKEGNNSKQAFGSLKKLIDVCVEDDIVVEDLTSYDVEYIFLMLRSKSIGEEVEILLKCEECDEKHPTSINIENEINLVRGKTVDPKIPLTSDVGVILRHPTIGTLTKTNTDDPVDVLVSCIESIYDSTTVHKVSDYPKNEVKEFVDSLSMKEVEKIQSFFESMPKLRYETTYKCTCGHETKATLEGISDFF
jgi:hypothetical protein